MKINTYFSPKRMGLLFMKDFRESWKEFAIAMGATFGFFFLCYFIAAKTGSVGNELYYGLFSPLLYFGGFVFTSRAFRAAHRKYLNHDWLMLPASTLEKFLEKLLLYSIVYSAAVLFLFSLFTAVSGLILGALLDVYFPVFNPVSPTVWKMIGHYLVTQSVFLLGAAWFRSHNFLKTVLALFVFSIVVSILGMLVTWLVFNDYFWIMLRGDFHYSIELPDNIASESLESFARNAGVFFEIVYFVLLAPLCWFGTWLRLREVEVRYGV